MITCETVESLRQHIRQYKQSGKSVAFVPTMGNLHAGHLALVEKARTLADRVVVSIFVNPLQFDENADFDAYPRTREEDARKLEQAGVDTLFLPGVEAIYPAGQSVTTRVNVPELSDILEGECRPGHFTGVATVVNKLFNMVQPDIAMFGEKDFQQLALIRRMVVELDMPIEIVSVATTREADGLAMSSRNSRLNPGERQLANRLYQALLDISDQLDKGGQDYAGMEQNAMQYLEDQGIKVEYITVRRSQDLLIPASEDRTLVVLGAVRIGNTRLIDNISCSV